MSAATYQATIAIALDTWHTPQMRVVYDDREFLQGIRTEVRRKAERAVEAALGPVPPGAKPRRFVWRVFLDTARYQLVFVALTGPDALAEADRRRYDRRGTPPGVSMLLRCEFCGAPASHVLGSPDVSLSASALDVLAAPIFSMGEACPRHRRIVQMRLERAHAPRRFARREGSA
jgi:hypothetical protein